MLITARWAARGQPAEAGPAGSGCEALEVGASVGEPLQPRWERLTSERPAPLPQARDTPPCAPPAFSAPTPRPPAQVSTSLLGGMNGCDLSPPHW